MAERRSDLDALRGFAMILGIVLHATAGFFSIPWPVHDTNFNSGLLLLYLWVHGFRMPMFFILSGFFTQAVCEQKGLKKLIRQRMDRIAIPLVLCCVTILPLNAFVSRKASQSHHREPVIESIVRNEIQDLRTWIECGGNPDHKDAIFGRSLVAWASFAHNLPALEFLIQRNANIQATDRTGNSPLHYAVFVGNAEAFDVLLRHGSDLNAKNNAGGNALQAIRSSPFQASELTTVLGLVEKRSVSDVKQGRQAIWKTIAESENLLRSFHGSMEAGVLDELVAYYWSFRGSDRFTLHFGSYQLHLFDTMIFDHLWFLVYLLWYLLVYAGLTAFGWVANHKTLWLAVFATFLGQMWMGPLGPSFGPDSEFGLLPAPHLWIYYAGFFFFGTALYKLTSAQRWLSTNWWWILPLSSIIVFPAALATIPLRFLATLLQPLFAWGMALGLMGAFEALFKKPSPTMRWLADSSYWMYLAHIPVVILLQSLVNSWPVSSWIKFSSVLLLTLFVLLISYDWLVRYSWVGRILNGTKIRPRSPTEVLKAST
jgi:peptidoglycan/LPS O-acetylase OafA/YrhL